MTQSLCLLGWAICAAFVVPVALVLMRVRPDTVSLIVTGMCTGFLVHGVLALLRIDSSLVTATFWVLAALVMIWRIYRRNQTRKSPSKEQDR